MQNVVLDLHVVVRDIALTDAVEIALAHFERIAAERTRDFIHHRLYRHHPLRSAKAAERSHRLGIRLAAIGPDAHVLEEVRIVRVRDCAIVDRTGQVCGIAAARREHQVNAEDPAGAVEADLVLDEKVVALAGDHEVVVAVGTQLDRPAEPVCRNRRGTGEDRGLRLLAAKAAAHAPALHGHVLRTTTDCLGRLELNFSRVLGRTVETQGAVLERYRVGDLSFEIELFLRTGAKLAFQLARCRGQCPRGIAAFHDERRKHPGLRSERLVHGEQRRKFLVIHDAKPRGAPGLIHGACQHQEHRLADILDKPVGKNRIVVQHRRTVVLAGNVGCRENRDHAG